ncbi:hypothetical protein CC86DRAFT_377259 [Ophiobolus disseminans]|uniref:DUF7707 domain-containing protein n=1 Tax=Ophiobolus disseminans TaxID=1469910 RepID=A0A6A7AHF9_9PLEO|nr:hypothetical protein CC86DRAFT_377259 [Ophiobolus disseminans]
MLYSSLIVVASAFAGASAQLLSNGTTYNTPIPCCSLSAGVLPQARREEVCEAQRNTCSELCGGVGSVRTNDCDRTSLVFSCVCSNTTVFDTTKLAPYEQTVPGLVCRDWYNTCINRTFDNPGQQLTQQFQCDLAKQQQCGNLTTRAAQSSGSPSGSASRTSGGSSPSQTSTGAGTSQSSAGVAAGLAMYGTPILAGGLLAVFGIAL